MAGMRGVEWRGEGVIAPMEEADLARYAFARAKEREENERGIQAMADLAEWSRQLAEAEGRAKASPGIREVMELYRQCKKNFE